MDHPHKWHRKLVNCNSDFIFKSRGHFVSISSQLGQHNFTIFNRYHLKKRIVFQILVNSSLWLSEQNFSITQNEAGNINHCRHIKAVVQLSPKVIKLSLACKVKAADILAIKKFSTY